MSKLANPTKVITGKDTRWSYCNAWPEVYLPVWDVIYSAAIWTVTFLREAKNRCEPMWIGLRYVYGPGFYKALESG